MELRKWNVIKPCVRRILYYSTPAVTTSPSSPIKGAPTSCDLYILLVVHRCPSTLSLCDILGYVSPAVEECSVSGVCQRRHTCSSTQLPSGHMVLPWPLQEREHCHCTDLRPVRETYNIIVVVGLLIHLWGRESRVLTVALFQSSGLGSIPSQLDTFEKCQALPNNI